MGSEFLALLSSGPTSARQLVRQTGVWPPLARRGRHSWPMAAHQLASALRKLEPGTATINVFSFSTEESITETVRLTPSHSH